MPEADESAQQQPSEEELRARIEEQLRKVRVQDLLVESAASILNLTARRIGKEDERDLGQAQVGIDAVRALVELIEGDVADQIRAALSELQISYARVAQGQPAGAPGEGAREQAQPPAEGEEPGAEQRERKPPPGLWTPPGTT